MIQDKISNIWIQCVFWIPPFATPVRVVVKGFFREKMTRAGGAGESTCKGSQFSRVSAPWAGAVKVPEFSELRPTYDAAETW